MSKMIKTLGLLGLAAVVVMVGWWLVGCSENAPSRINSPPQGHSDRPHDLREDFDYMIDNALLADMSISPAHFVPHTPELNASGVRRLERYASILSVYGGTLNYDGVDDEETLATERIGRVKSFLIASGLTPETFSVEKGLAGGSGLDATEAVDIRKESKFKAGKTDGNQSPLQ